MQQRYERRGEPAGPRPEDDDEGWERQTSGRTRPPWFDRGWGGDGDGRPSLSYRKLEEDIRVDVAVVGGGIAGITTGYLLSREGRKVAVLDDGNIGSGETGRTTAHITHALDDRYYRIEKLHGADKARLAAESQTAAIDFIESTVREERIACDFERLDGYLFLDPTDRKRSLEAELDSVHRAGIVGAELVERAPLRSFDTGPCIRFPDQAQFHPLKYLSGVAGALVRHGGSIFTATHAQEVRSTGVRTSEGARVDAESVVIATNDPIVDRAGKIYLKQDAFRSYAIAAKVKRGAVHKALYWDTGNQRSKNVVPPYHYIRVQEPGEGEEGSDGDLLIVGGEDHSTANAVEMEGRFEVLERWTRERFPIGEVVYRWSGQVMEPRDSIALIGRNPGDKKRKNVFIATGDSGNGITNGTVAGILLNDLVLGKRNDWSSLYDPSRRIRGHPSAPYGGRPRLHKRDPESVLRIAGGLRAGEGRVLEVSKKGEPVAIYRDLKGKLRSFSTVCPHLGCTVRWNGVEKSFDCPCHGSRFSNSGVAVNGPANDGLEPARLPGASKKEEEEDRPPSPGKDRRRIRRRARACRGS